MRSIYTNLKDPRNPDLRRRVMTGEVDPQVRAGRPACSPVCACVHVHQQQQQPLLRGAC